MASGARPFGGEAASTSMFESMRLSGGLPHTPRPLAARGYLLLLEPEDSTRRRACRTGLRNPRQLAEQLRPWHLLACGSFVGLAGAGMVSLRERPRRIRRGWFLKKSSTRRNFRQSSGQSGVGRLPERHRPGHHRAQLVHNSLQWLAKAAVAVY
jgi:hypothetical protein